MKDHKAQTKVDGRDRVPWTHWRINKLLINWNLHCYDTAAYCTLYAVLQEFGTRLLPLLSKCNQGERFIEGQLAQESFGAVNVRHNLRRTKTTWPEGQRFSVWDLNSTAVCIPPGENTWLDTKGMICREVRMREAYHKYYTSRALSLYCISVINNLLYKATLTGLSV